MRQENDIIEDDIHNRCFICSLKKDEFEKHNHSFRTHITEEHNMWQYIFLKLYLQMKDPLNYSQIEYYIKQQIDNNNYHKIFPINRSLSLQIIENQKQKMNNQNE